MKDSGLEQERFRLEWISASEAARFANVVKEMTESLKALGPSPHNKNFNNTKGKK